MTSAPDSAPVYPATPTSLTRPAIIAGVVFAIVVAISIVAGHPFFALFFALGLVAIFVNAKLVIRSVTAVTAEADPRKQILAMNSFGRLGVITVVALAAAYFWRPDGLGVMFGLALGQVILILNAVIPVMKGLRKQL